jgi:hypothetical protein
MDHTAVAPVFATLLVAVFAVDGYGPWEVVALHRALSAASCVSAAILFSVVLVLHDDWCCYKTQTLNALIYGRCTVYTAMIKHRPDETQRCGLHSWTMGEVVVVVGTVVCIVVLAITAIARIAIVVRHVHRMHLPFEHTNVSGRCTIYFLRRTQWLLACDPMSIAFAYGAISMRLSPFHVVARALGTVALTCLLLLVPSSAAVGWRRWAVLSARALFGSFVLLHHLYVSFRLRIYIRTVMQHVQRSKLVNTDAVNLQRAMDTALSAVKP